MRCGSTGEVGVICSQQGFRGTFKGWCEIHGAKETPREFIAWKNGHPNVKALDHITRIIQLLLNGVLRCEFVSAGRQGNIF